MNRRRTPTEILTGEKLLQSLFPDIDSVPSKLPAPSPIEALWHWRRSPDPKYVRLRAQLIPTKSCQPADLIELASGNGFEEVTGPVTEVLRRLSRRVQSKPTSRVRRIPVARVLSHIWQLGRVARNFELSANGTKPPPVDVAEVRFHGESFYLVYDGHHRTEVCKMRGDEYVHAKVSEILAFEPQVWTLVRGGVCADDGSTMALDADDEAAARWLGIRRNAMERRR